MDLIEVLVDNAISTDYRNLSDQTVEAVKKLIIDVIGDTIAGSSAEGIEAALKGMIQRPNRLHVLRMLGIPVLLIAGAKDNYIPLDVSERISDAANIPLEILENSGHMGFLEEKERVIKILHEFIEICE